jgi:hypothetical protein
MTPYHYAIVQARDATYASERRNVGLLVVSPAAGRAWVRRGNLKQRAHLLGDDATFVRALLDVLADQAAEVARDGDAATVHGWLRSCSLPTEDSLTLAEPGVGIAEDLTAEVRRLRAKYLGKAGGGGRSPAEKVSDRVLRDHGLRAAFAPRAFPSGPATWKFPRVADAGGQPVVLNALQFGQTTPEGVLDAAFRNLGRASEVAHWHQGLRWVTVADGPTHGETGRAFARARELMSEGGLNVVPPEPEHLERALSRLGVVDGDGNVARA